MTRDGSVWLRFGYEHQSLRWSFDNERAHPLRDTILDADAMATLAAVNYSDWCVLTDVRLEIRMHKTSRTSWVSVFDPKLRRSRHIVFRKNVYCSEDLLMNVTLSDDKQRLLCSGRRRCSSAVRRLPNRKLHASTVFLQRLYLDPSTRANDRCALDDSSYSFHGAYYYAYVKLATCPVPRGKSFNIKIYRRRFFVISHHSCIVARV